MNPSVQDLPLAAATLMGSQSLFIVAHACIILSADETEDFEVLSKAFLELTPWLVSGWWQ